MFKKKLFGDTTIQRKIITVVLLLFLVLFGLLYSLCYNSMDKMLDEREYENMQSQLQLANNVLSFPVDFLPDVTRSWASDWNKAYDFVVGELDKFPEYYLNDYPFRLYNLDFITVLDAKGAVLYEGLYQDEGNVDPLPSIDLAQAYAKIGTISMENFSQSGHQADARKTGASGFIKDEGLIYYISAQPITREEEDSPCVGTLIFGRVINHEFDYVSYDPNIELTIKDKRELSLSDMQMKDLKESDTLIRINEQGTLEAFTNISDVYGENNLFLSMSSPRYLYNKGFLFIVLNLIAITVFCAIMIITVIMLLDSIIVKPLSSLVGDVNKINFDSVGPTLVPDYRNKEFNFLAEAVNNMLERIKTHRDIIKKNNESIYFHANYDVLTGLKNRISFGNVLLEEIEVARRDLSFVGVFLIDLDRFKFVNDTLGHTAGDAYIVSITKRLQEELHHDVTIGRLGGDEFAIILPAMDDKYKIHLYANTIISLFEAPFFAKDRAMYISASIGSSTYPDDGRDIDTLIKNSEIAMYRAKELGGNMYCRYDSELNNVLQRKLYIENKIRSAISNGCTEFQAYFQAKAQSQNNVIACCEALMRWVTPDGIIGPNEFIPLAEETGLIVPLSKWMLEEACRCNKIFEEQDIDQIISVNIPAQVLLHKDFISMIVEAVEKSGSDAKKLDIEITEATLVEDIQRVRDILIILHNMGITVSIDDFGTGYSSLGYLKKLPIDRIKIDRSFISCLHENEEDKTIVNAIVAMAKNLHMLVTAEGVEDAEQFAYLKSIQCDEIQGYYVSRPIPCNDYIAFHKKWTSEHVQVS